MTVDTRMAKLTTTGEFAEQAAYDSAHQQNRNEHRDQGNADRDDGEPDFPCALERGLQRLLSILNVARDVFDHDDRVIDGKTCRNRPCH